MEYAIKLFLDQGSSLISPFPLLSKSCGFPLETPRLQKESLFTAYLLRGLVGKDKHGLSLVVRVQQGAHALGQLHMLTQVPVLYRVNIRSVIKFNQA